MAEKRISFFVTCEKGHGPSFSWEPVELEAQLATGHLRLYCGLCGTFWNATPEEIHNLKRHLEAKRKEWAAEA